MFFIAMLEEYIIVLKRIIEFSIGDILMGAYSNFYDIKKDNYIYYILFTFISNAK